MYDGSSGREREIGRPKKTRGGPELASLNYRTVFVRAFVRVNHSTMPAAYSLPYTQSPSAFPLRIFYIFLCILFDSHPQNLPVLFLFLISNVLRQEKKVERKNSILCISWEI